jgi:hypothetical protein
MLKLDFLGLALSRPQVLCYLNDVDWSVADGGALRVHTDGVSSVAVLPTGGRLAMFYADSMPHEVEPSHTERHAVTLWYYDRLERVTALDRARDSGGLSAATATQSDSARAEAQALVRLLMVEDGDIATPTAADCSELSHKVARLSPQALAIGPGPPRAFKRP